MRYYYKVTDEPFKGGFLSLQDVSGIEIRKESKDIVEGLRMTAEAPSEWFSIFKQDESLWKPGEFSSEAEARRGLLENLNFVAVRNMERGTCGK